MNIKKTEGDNAIIVRYEHGAVLFSAIFKNGINKRADIAMLIQNHFSKHGHTDINIRYSEERYTPFIVNVFGQEREIFYTLIENYIVN